MQTVTASPVTKLVAVSGNTRPPRAGIGRPKGIPNKATRALKEAILQAADDVGMDGKGRDGLIGYLRRVATEDARSFVSLLGRVLPLQVTGEGGGPIQIEKIERVIIDQ
jgi:hypothetical protein